MTTQTEQQLVRTTTWNLRDLVQKSWGKEWSKPDVAYEFSNGRKFEDSGANGGPYEPTED